MSPTRVLAPRVGEPQAPGSAVPLASGHLHGPRSASRAEIAARGPEAASGAVTVLVGWEEKGGRAPRDGGGKRVRAQSRAVRVRGGEKGAKGGAEAPELLLLLPGLPRAPRASLPP